MITRKTLDEAVFEAQRFLKRAKKVKELLKKRQMGRIFRKSRNWRSKTGQYGFVTGVSRAEKTRSIGNKCNCR